MILDELKKELQTIAENAWYGSDTDRGDMLQACYKAATLTAEAMVGEFDKKEGRNGFMNVPDAIVLGYNLRVAEEHQLAREIKKLSE